MTLDLQPQTDQGQDLSYTYRRVGFDNGTSIGKAVGNFKVRAVSRSGKLFTRISCNGVVIGCAMLEDISI